MKIIHLHIILPFGLHIDCQFFAAQKYKEKPILQELGIE
jgi:hypothetical protein